MHSCNNCCQAKLHIHYIFCTSVALVIQCAKHTGHMIMSSMAYSARLTQKWHNFVKKLQNIKCIWFSLQLLSATSPSKKGSARYYHKCTGIFMWSSLYSCQILITLEFYQQFFKKLWNIKFHGNLSSGNRAVQCRQRGMMKLIAAFHKCPWTKNHFYLAQTWRHQAPLKTV